MCVCESDIMSGGAVVSWDCVTRTHHIQSRLILGLCVLAIIVTLSQRLLQQITFLVLRYCSNVVCVPHVSQVGTCAHRVRHQGPNCVGPLSGCVCVCVIEVNFCLLYSTSLSPSSS